jgi:hypothetical protein
VLNTPVGLRRRGSLPKELRRQQQCRCGSGELQHRALRYIWFLILIVAHGIITSYLKLYFTGELAELIPWVPWGWRMVTAGIALLLVLVGLVWIIDFCIAEVREALQKVFRFFRCLLQVTTRLERVLNHSNLGTRISRFLSPPFQTLGLDDDRQE